VLIWFAAGAFILVEVVFRDAAIDYRLVMAAAVGPAIVDLVFGGVVLPHTLLWCVGLLVIVMVATIGRRSLRRRLLAVPVGAFVGLVLDGVWMSTDLVMWPLLGSDAPDPPLLDRPWVIRLLMEALGIVAAVWAVRRFRLTEPNNRARFVQSGRLDRGLVGPSGR
jgi:hypothetical protein